MIFLRKNGVYALVLAGFLTFANETPPTTPPKQTSSFWRTASDSSSEVSSAASSAAPSALNSPEAFRTNSASAFASPLRKSLAALSSSSPSFSPKRSRNEFDEESPAKKPKNKISFADLIKESIGDITKRVRDNVLDKIEDRLDNASSEQLKDYYIDFKQNAFGPGQDGRDSESYDNLVRKPIINAFFDVATKKSFDTSFLDLPLFSFKHFENPERSGGYHKENDSLPVQVLLKNPQTSVYGGLFDFSGRRNDQKFSSFVPKNMSMSEVAQQVCQAYAKRRIKKGNRIIGTSISGIDWEMYTQPNGLEVNSVFPLIAYADTSKDTQLSLDIADSESNFQNHLFNRADLIGFAQQNQNKLAEYEGKDFKIIDIASALPGANPDARSVYVKVLKSDL
jgi:hypothetical protein